MNDEEIFTEALNCVEQDRDAFLNKACCDDEQRVRIQSLLAQAESPDSFFLEAPMPMESTDAFVPEKGGANDQTIGPYRLREQIGEGGMGVVYVAEQSKPVKRKVALKVIKPGMDTKEVIARFEAERQALAMMDHPSIAKVFDAGMTESGRPYFAMELINGVPITKYCDDQKLGIRERLKLFIQVCNAISHAHQKGVIHRDVKPSNVLVTLHDGNPVPVVIDFGVAKATNQSLTEQTIYTRLNQVVGTTLYMSPEQAELSRYGVDTRTDVYALGVLLYELLTGTTPFDAERLSRAGFDEVRRIIREEEPPKPSTRVSSLGDTATSVSLLRATDPNKLRHSIRGDLDWIVMKALEKDRNRRYESASRFAEDVENYLDDQLVEARPPSMAYQLQKLWRRNRVLASTLGSVILALSLGLGVVAWEWQKQIELTNENVSLILKLKESLSNEILELVLGGQRNHARTRVDEFDQLFPDEDDYWNQLNENMLLSTGNDTERDRACANLEEIVKGKDDLLTRSLLMAMYLETSQEWKYWQQIGTLKDSQPTNFMEYLLRGNAHSFSIPDLAIGDLSNAVESKPSSGIARALFSRSLHRKSLDVLGDTAAAMELAIEALQQADIARSILPYENRFALMSQLEALSGLIQLQMHEGARERDVQERKERLVAILTSSSETEYDWTVHHAQLDALGVLDRHGLEVPIEIRQRITHVPETAFVAKEVAVSLIQYYYENDKTQSAYLGEKWKRVLSNFADLGFIAKYENLYLAEGLESVQTQYAMEMYMGGSAPKQQLNGINRWSTLQLLGQKAKAVEYGKAFLEWTEQQADNVEIARKLVPVAKRMAGVADESDEEILAKCDNAHSLVHTACWLGFEAFASGRADDARRHFELVKSTNAYHWYHYTWALIFLIHMDDPEWLPWIERN